MSKHPIPGWLRSQFSRIEDEVQKLGPCGVFTQMRTVTQTYFEQQAEAAQPPACCTPTAEENALLAAVDYRPEELWGVGGKPSCPKCYAAPQPSALGGEPEVIHQYLSKGCFQSWHPLSFEEVDVAKQEGFEVRELIDRAHLAPLQSEIDILKYDCKVANSVINAQKSEIDQLKARCDELEGLVRKWRKEAGSTFAYMARESDAALSKPAGSDT